MTTSHTPGPWEYLSEEDGLADAITSKTEWICDFDTNPSPANARLIAAAPDLLEALIYCRQKIAYMQTHGEWYSPGRAIEKADAAIFQATGKEIAQ